MANNDSSAILRRVRRNALGLTVLFSGAVFFLQKTRFIV